MIKPKVKKVLKELGNLLFDFAKIVFAGVVVERYFSSTSDASFVVIGGVAVLVISVIVGIFFIFISAEE